MDREPPSHLMIPDVKGRVLYATVYDNGVDAGVVWMAAKRAQPRAGIMLNPANDPPSEALQRDLGAVALRMMTDQSIDATEWLEFLAATRTGAGGSLMVGEVRAATSLRQLYRIAGHSLA